VHAGSSGGVLLDEHGQLIGLVISGVALGGQIGVGLNEFLGIDDAWRALQIEPQISTMDARVSFVGKHLSRIDVYRAIWRNHPISVCTSSGDGSRSPGLIAK